MIILKESNVKEVIDSIKVQGIKIVQSGIEKTESIKTNFLFLGEIAKIKTFEKAEKISILERDITNAEDKTPLIKSYSIEVSICKVVALIVLLPIFLIQSIFTSKGPLTRDVTLNFVAIEAYRDANGKVQMETEKFDKVRFENEKK